MIELTWGLCGCWNTIKIWTTKKDLYCFNDPFVQSQKKSAYFVKHQKKPKNFEQFFTLEGKLKDFFKVVTRNHPISCFRHLFEPTNFFYSYKKNLRLRINNLCSTVLFNSILFSCLVDTQNIVLVFLLFDCWFTLVIMQFMIIPKHNGKVHWSLFSLFDVCLCFVFAFKTFSFAFLSVLPSLIEVFGKFHENRALNNFTARWEKQKLNIYRSYFM